MPNFEDTVPVQSEGEQCPNCYEAVLSPDGVCVVCGYALVPDLPPGEQIMKTGLLDRKPSAHARAASEVGYFDDDLLLILQVLPSGTCFTTQVTRPVVLGRQHPGDDCDLWDLTEFSAVQHGVSRQHCMLRRLNNRLVVSDLDSTNGTSLNGYPLPPLEDRLVAHGDKLILGTLHLIVSFSTQ